MSTNTVTNAPATQRNAGTNNNIGSGGRAGRRGGNNRNGNNSNNSNWRSTRTGSGSMFKGTVSDMNGHVFQCYGETTEKNQFARTMEELDSYIGLHFKHYPSDIKTMVKLLSDVRIRTPVDYADGASKTVIRIWEKEVDAYVRQKEVYASNKVALYSVVWGQCSEAMQTKVKTDPTYTSFHETSDSLLLIKTIKGIAYRFETKKNIYHAVDDAK